MVNFVLVFRVTLVKALKPFWKHFQVLQLWKKRFVHLNQTNCENCFLSRYDYFSVWLGMLFKCENERGQKTRKRMQQIFHICISTCTFTVGIFFNFKAMFSILHSSSH